MYVCTDVFLHGGTCICISTCNLGGVYIYVHTLFQILAGFDSTLVSPE